MIEIIITTGLKKIIDFFIYQFFFRLVGYGDFTPKSYLARLFGNFIFLYKFWIYKNLLFFSVYHCIIRTIFNFNGECSNLKLCFLYWYWKHSMVYFKLFHFFKYFQAYQNIKYAEYTSDLKNKASNLIIYAFRYWKHMHKSSKQMNKNQLKNVSQHLESKFCVSLYKFNKLKQYFFF